MFRNHAAAVERTLAYAAVFGGAGTQRDVWRFLHSPQLVSPKKLRNIPSFSLIPAAQAVTEVDCQKWRAVAATIEWFSRVPWIRTVWVTGALAAGSATTRDDLDFLIITDPNRLWLSRALLVGLGLLTGHYRSHWLANGRTADRWCCNIWLEPGALALPANRRTLYEARELVQAVPVYNRAGERARLLLDRNAWAGQYLANGYRLARRRAAALAPAAAWILPLPGWLLDVGNHLLGLAQRRFMARRRTRETVQPDRAFFHPRDTRSFVQQRYEKICADQGIAPWFNEPAP